MIDPQDKPIPIHQACKEVWGNELGPDGFRSWAKAVGLRIMRHGRKDFVTVREVMTCLRNQSLPDSSSIRNAVNGSSGTELPEYEQVAALKAKLRP